MSKSILKRFSLFCGMVLLIGIFLGGAAKEEGGCGFLGLGGGDSNPLPDEEEVFSEDPEKIDANGDLDLLKEIFAGVHQDPQKTGFALGFAIASQAVSKENYGMDEKEDDWSPQAKVSKYFKKTPHGSIANTMTSWVRKVKARSGKFSTDGMDMEEESCDSEFEGPDLSCDVDFTGALDGSFIEQFAQDPDSEYEPTEDEINALSDKILEDCSMGVEIPEGCELTVPEESGSMAGWASLNEYSTEFNFYESGDTIYLELTENGVEFNAENFTKFAALSSETCVASDVSLLDSVNGNEVGATSVLSEGVVYIGETSGGTKVSFSFEKSDYYDNGYDIEYNVLSVPTYKTFKFTEKAFISLDACSLSFESSSVGLEIGLSAGGAFEEVNEAFFKTEDESDEGENEDEGEDGGCYPISGSLDYAITINGTIGEDDNQFFASGGATLEKADLNFELSCEDGNVVFSASESGSMNTEFNFECNDKSILGTAKEEGEAEGIPDELAASLDGICEPKEDQEGPKSGMIELDKVTLEFSFDSSEDQCSLNAELPLGKIEKKEGKDLPAAYLQYGDDDGYKILPSSSEDNVTTGEICGADNKCAEFEIEFSKGDDEPCYQITIPDKKVDEKVCLCSEM